MRSSPAFGVGFQGYAGSERHPPGSGDLRQGHRRRLSRWRLRRAPRSHGAGSASRPGVPGRHAQRQSAGDVCGPRDAAAPCRWPRVPAARALGARLERALAGLRASGGAARARCSGWSLARSGPPMPLRTLAAFPPMRRQALRRCSTVCSSAASTSRRALSKWAFCRGAHRGAHRAARAGAAHATAGLMRARAATEGAPCPIP